MVIKLKVNASNLERMISGQMFSAKMSDNLSLITESQTDIFVHPEEVLKITHTGDVIIKEKEYD